MTKTLIIFTRNELEGLKWICPRIPFSLFDEVFAIDGRSTDGTIEFLQKMGIAVYRQKKMGRVNAMIEAMEQAHGYAVVFLSADGNEDPKDIPVLLSLLDGNDIVIASRFMKGGRSDDSDDPLLFRRAMSILLAKLVNLRWRIRVTDATNGLRAIKRSLWEKATIAPGYHSAELQLTIQAAKMKGRLAEIPTVEHRRLGQVRKASAFKMAVSLQKVFLKELLTRT